MRSPQLEYRCLCNVHSRVKVLTSLLFHCLSLDCPGLFTNEHHSLSSYCVGSHSLTFHGVAPHNRLLSLLPAPNRGPTEVTFSAESLATQILSTSSRNLSILTHYRPIAPLREDSQFLFTTSPSAFYQSCASRIKHVTIQTSESAQDPRYNNPQTRSKRSFRKNSNPFTKTHGYHESLESTPCENTSENFGPSRNPTWQWEQY
jgi:hypothetical protein